MTEYRFPDGFWWGSASSAPQTEGTVEGDGRGFRRQRIEHPRYWHEQ